MERIKNNLKSTLSLAVMLIMVVNGASIIDIYVAGVTINMFITLIVLVKGDKAEEIEEVFDRGMIGSFVVGVLIVWFLSFIAPILALTIKTEK